MSQGDDGHSPAPDGTEQAVTLVRAVVSRFTGKDVKSLEKVLDDFGCQEFAKHLIFDFIRSESQNYQRSLWAGDRESFDPIQGLVAGLRAVASSLQGNAGMAVHIGQLVIVANHLNSSTQHGK